MRTDDEIIRLCQKGRSEGFSLLLAAYQDRVYRRAYSFLRNREDALDATQDVFLRVVQAIGHFRTGSPIWPWLRQVTTNTCLNRIRTASARPQTVPSTKPGIRRRPHDPESEALATWDREWLSGPWMNSPLQRMAVVLRHREGLSYDEIARTMNLR